MLFFRNTNCVHCLSYCSFVESLETGKYESLNFVLFQECFGSFGPFHFHIINLWLGLSIPAKNKATEILMGIQLNL